VEDHDRVFNWLDFNGFFLLCPQNNGVPHGNGLDERAFQAWLFSSPLQFFANL
jgi:hypothetical protein